MTTDRAPVIARMAELWRYPVKSMGGERVNALEVFAGGIAHDRTHAALSSGAPVGKPRVTSRERAALLQYRAELRDGTVCVTAPGGAAYGIDDPALLVELRRSLPHGHEIRIESDPADVPYTDVRPVALMTRQALLALETSFGRRVDPRRFRANIVLDCEPEQPPAGSRAPDAYLHTLVPGRAIRIGAASTLRLLERIPRCRMVTLDPDTSAPDPDLMRHLDRFYDGRFGIYAAVVQTGTLREGDAVHLYADHATFAAQLSSNR